MPVYIPVLLISYMPELYPSPIVPDQLRGGKNQKTGLNQGARLFLTHRQLWSPDIADGGMTGNTDISRAPVQLVTTL